MPKLTHNQCKLPTATTHRRTNEAMEGAMERPVEVLDHGFIRVVDYMGDEAAIVEMARVSYGLGTKTPKEDKALLRYLMRHRHTSPFEGCEIKLHVKLPIFVARQWIRHRTASVNEVSGRYSVLPGEFYIPKAERLAAQSTTNKQGSGEPLDEAAVDEILDILEASRDQSKAAYDAALDAGLTRELARLPLSVNLYTEWYWKIDLHNLLHFLALRMDGHAQYEIRAYAYEIGKLVEAWLPNVWQAFLDFRVNAVTISGPIMEALDALGILPPANVGHPWLTVDELVGRGVAKSEAEEFLAQFD